MTSRLARAVVPLRGSKSAVEKLWRELVAAARAASCAPKEINSGRSMEEWDYGIVQIENATKAL